MIRTATADDIPAITSIYADAVRNGTASFELTPPAPDEMHRRWKALRDGDFPFLVAEHGSVVAGYAYAGPYRPRAAYRHSLESSVYVAPSKQGHGLGRRLMSEVIAIAEAQGYRQMIAVIGDETNTASRRLHVQLGFREVGILEHVGFKHGRWLGTVLMQRTLGPGATTDPA